MAIMFEGRYKRARKLQQERTPRSPQENIDFSSQMEKGDLPAMIIAALITFVPAALVVLAVIAAAGYFFIMH